jgi:hypothetical protein
MMRRYVSIDSCVSLVHGALDLVVVEFTGEFAKDGGMRGLSFEMIGYRSSDCLGGAQQ